MQKGSCSEAQAYNGRPHGCHGLYYHILVLPLVRWQGSIRVLVKAHVMTCLCLNILLDLNCLCAMDDGDKFLMVLFSATSNFLSV